MPRHSDRAADSTVIEMWMQADRHPHDHIALENARHREAGWGRRLLNGIANLVTPSGDAYENDGFH